MRLDLFVLFAWDFIKWEGFHSLLRPSKFYEAKLFLGISMESLQFILCPKILELWNFVLFSLFKIPLPLLMLFKVKHSFVSYVTEDSGNSGCAWRFSAGYGRKVLHGPFPRPPPRRARDETRGAVASAAEGSPVWHPGLSPACRVAVRHFLRGQTTFRFLAFMYSVVPSFSLWQTLI